ncbi:MAG TPA: adenylosuccinate lyase [Candidatus Limadaptatus stercorigallinarum]|uniref:Adenylosuccinate lyase n=1 Tax=Candidatus Limadaptatus stercorigallinarum TaxID=2840845 RepID=A0A9D1HRR6_9FIRM|nr:adenylosuccinate lyase [Christensenellales bacterium]HIU21077.1 adenylosuccinate lyase [Candidatus Limadaptatus stercorigallinarum]
MDSYVSPLCERYASEKMKHIFSPDFKFTTWRKLWIALAEAEKELGIAITEEQIAEMKAHVADIDYAYAAEREKEVRHDVMAHVLTFGKACPKAKPIIHLGATSCYVGDNTDIIQMKEALLQIRSLLLAAIEKTADFAEKYKSLPTLAYTHYQPAQPTTVGKRASLWLHDLVLDFYDLEYRLSSLKMLGCKGTTGTAASFLELFGGDRAKVKKLDALIAEKMGFAATYPVSGQTYSRKVDYNVLSVLCSIAQSATKFSNDIRLLSNLKEVEEPFESKQIGSSAMAYKRNPMRSERMASLSRYVIVDSLNPAVTAATQWFERTLDDSANKRISVPEAFLAVDAVLSLYINVISGLKLYPKIIERNLNRELPFMATENILMYCVKEKGGDRQELHEAIRKHSVAAAAVVKEEGGENDLLDRILADPLFGLTKEELDSIMDVRQFVGCAAEQTEEFLSETVRPLLAANPYDRSAASAIRV